MRRTNQKTKKIYLDHAASTPVAPEVLRAMRPYFSEKHGNPGSLHSFGQETLAAVDRSRETLAVAIGADFRQIVFTGSATEANNLALRGAVSAWRSARTGSGRAASRPRIIVSAVEHESVLDTALDMEKSGVEVVILPVDKQGIVKMDALQAALDERTVLVSVMYANNETGAVQPIAKMAKTISAFRARGASPATPYPLFHTDAAQAFQFLDCSVAVMGVDLMTVSAHKIYGPKGIGALYVGSREWAVGNDAKRPRSLLPTAYSLLPIITGGGQEFGLRSGTENVAAIAGFAATIEYIEKDKAGHGKRIAKIKEQFVGGLKKIHPKAKLNGPKDGLPHIANVWLPGREAQDMLIRLDLAGIAVAAGSACTARSSQPSHVLRAMGYGQARTRESLRVSFGRANTSTDVKALLGGLKKILDA